MKCKLPKHLRYIQSSFALSIVNSSLTRRGVIKLKLYYKLAAGTGAAILAAALMTGSALAADLEISGNGDDSTNKIEVTQESCCTVVQSSETHVWAGVSASASTGGNEASGNTGGDVSVTSGNATATAGVTVVGGSNTATNPCCCQPNPCEGGGCPEGASAVISGNGADSNNQIKITKKSKSTLVQGSSTNVGAWVKAKTKTGKNKANSNTGGTTTIQSGSGTSTSGLTVVGGSNTLNP